MMILTWPLRLIAFVGWFIGAVVSSNVTVLRDLLTPGLRAKPGIVALPTRCRTDVEITALSVIITLTPGTLTMGVNGSGSAKRVLYVHGMYAADADDLRADLTRMEDWLLWAIRPKGVGS